MINLSRSSIRRLSSFVGLEGLNKADDFLNVAEAAKRRASELVQEICSEDVENGSDAVRKMDEVSNTLCKVADAAYMTYFLVPDRRWMQSGLQAYQYLLEYIGGLNSNESLFHSLNKYSGDTMTAEERVVADSLLWDFRSYGVGNPKKELITGLASRESSLCLQFDRNADAAAEGEQPWSAGLPIPHPVPTELYWKIITSSSASLREEVYKKYYSHPKENLAVLKDLLEVRHEWADALGFESYSHLKLTTSISVSPDAVRTFLSQTSESLRAKSEDDISKLEAEKGNKIFRWDLPFYKNEVYRKFTSHKAVISRFNVRSLIRGISSLFEHLMDVKMEEDRRGSYHEAVQVFRVFDEGEFVGQLYCDLLKRDLKRPITGLFSVRCRKALSETEYQTPIAVLSTNFESGDVSYPQLTTLLHEFGHALHNLLSKTKLQHLFGNRGPFDLTEIPAHFFERLTTCPEALQYILEASSGEKIALKSVENTIDAGNLFSGMDAQDRIRIALLDQALHSRSHYKSTSDIKKEIWEGIPTVPFVPETFEEARLTHLTSYGARYFSYIFADKMAEIIWDQHLKDDFFDKAKWRFIKENLFYPGSAKKAQAYARDLIGNRLIACQGGWIPR